MDRQHAESQTSQQADVVKGAGPSQAEMMVAALPQKQAGADALVKFIVSLPALREGLIRAGHARFGNAQMQRIINKVQWELGGTLDLPVAVAPTASELADADKTLE
ncbi:MAG: hypothetical protein KBG28_21295 [Kofleriaceae bacterium]|jgi:hypothetical protein|nr:hypothetical protein [Kofleriaceae bacterium]MBP6836809.1 hypothetical protein [Kofleriaceae bacterium]MBP9206523.1 hypothetical protein [Kofleriaceae bacterium]